MVIQVNRFSDGARRITSVAEITGMEQEVITMQEIFTFEKLGITGDGKVVGRFRATGVRPKVCERLKTSGIHLPADMFDGVVEVR
jgi:pilus assembly protein CpaF